MSLTIKKSKHDNLSFVQSGRGAIPLLMIHGNSIDHQSWNGQLHDPQWQEKFSMFALDLPGHGQSSRLLAEHYTWNQITEIMQHFVEDHLPRNYWLMGHSLGAHLSLSLARKLPPERLLLVQAGPGDSLDDIMSNMRPMPTTPYLFTGDVTRAQSEALFADLCDQPGACAQLQHLFHTTDPNFRIGIAQSLGTDVTYSECNVMNTVPEVLVVLGHEDKLLQTDVIAQKLRSLKHAQTLFVSTSSHYGHFAQWAAWNAEVLQYIFSDV